MAEQPTILIGSLNDKELTESINALVNNVNKATQDMTRSFDTAIDAMKKKLQELGTQKIDFGGSADGGSKRRTSMQEKEKNAVTDVTMSYDRLVGALQMAQRAFKVLENRKTFSADDVQEYYERLNRVKEIQEKLNIATGQMYLQRAEQASLPFNGKAIVEQIALQEKGSTEIRKMNDYYRELEKGAQSVIQPTREYSQEIQRLAQQIKQSTQFQEQGYTTVGKAVVYKREELSVEEQLYQAQQKYGDEVLKTTDGIESERASMRQFGGEAKSVSENLVNVHEQTIRSRELMAQQAKGGMVQSFDDLRQRIADVLDIERAQVIQLDASKASYAAVSLELKQMNEAYSLLAQKDRDSDMGRELAHNIQIASRELQRISQQKMRPTSLQEVMGLDEKTLDDMAYKVKQLQLYRSGLNTSTAQGSQEIEQVNKAITELTQRQQKYMASVNKSTTANNALTRSFNYMKNRLAFMFTVGATTNFVKQLAEVRGEYEMTERALGILVDSAQRGTQIFQELSQMALISPYTLIELSNAAKQLTAYEVAAKDVVDVTRRLADISAAVGAPVERLTYALGQIKAYEYLNSRDARIFANAGIPLVKQLSQYYSELEGRLVSVGDVYDRIKKKAVSYNDVMGVLTRMTDEGGRFFDYQAKVADTLKVQLANLTLAWNNMLNAIGEKESGLLSGSIKALKQVFLAWKDIEKVANNLLKTFLSFKALQLVSIGYMITFRSETALAQKYIAMLDSAMKKMRTTLIGLAKSPLTWLTAATYLFINIKGNIKDAERAMRDFNLAIKDGTKESAKSLNEFLTNTETVAARTKALAGALTPEDSQKAWEMVRDEIENSAAAADIIIPQLLKIEDLNERVSAAFTMAENIQNAQERLAELVSEFKTIQNGPLPHIFGDFGLGEELTRYGEYFNAVKRQNEIYADPKSTWWKRAWSSFAANTKAVGGWLSASVADDIDPTGEKVKEKVSEFVKEASQTIRQDLGVEGAKNAEAVAEAIQQVFNVFYQQYPNISAQMRDYFETWAYDMFGDEFEGVFDQGLIAEQKFFKILRKNASTLFTDINEELVQNGFSAEQLDALGEALYELGEDWAPALTAMLGDEMQSEQWYMSVLAHFDIENRDAIQRLFDRIFNKELNDKATKGSYATLRRKSGESDLEWEKRLADAEKDYTERIEQANYMLDQETDKQGDVYKAREKNLELDKQNLAAIKRVQQEFRLRSKEELDAAKKAGQGEDELSTAIKKEIQLVTDIQKRYKDYKSMGMDSTDALNLAAKEYNKTLKEVETTLRKLGVTTISNQDLMEKTPTEIRDFYTQQIKDIQRASTAIKDFNGYMEKSLNLNYDVEKNFYEATRFLVTRNEGFKANAYWNPGEYWDKEQKEKKYTVGYGFISLITRGWEKVTADTTITAEEAEKEIEAQLKYRLNKIRKLFEVYAPNIQLTPQQIMSYLDLAFQSDGGPEAILKASEGNLDKIGQMLATAAYDRLNEEQRKTMGSGVLARDRMRQQAWVSHIGSEAAKPLAEAFDEIMLNFDDQVDATVIAMKNMVMNGGSVFAEIQALVDAGKAPEAIEALEKAIAALNVEIAQTDYKNRAENFNAAIDALKDGYEFAKEMKDNPSLGHVFADMLGLGEDDLKDLPKDAEDVMIRIQRLLIEKYDRGVDIKSVLNATDLQQWFAEQGIDPNGDFGKQIQDAVKLVNDLRVKEVKEQIDDWNKLLEKYAEYEYKRTEIIKQAEREREIARKNNASDDIFKAIDKKERQSLASLDFEEFQKSATWLTATNDLATLTDNALRGLIDALEDYKAKAQDLDPKDIKSINSALRKMHKELRKGNPFTAIAEAIQDAKDRTDDFAKEIAETETEFNILFAKFESGFATDDEIERMQELSEHLGHLKVLATELGKVSPTALVSGINDAIGVARTASNEFKELAEAIGGDQMTDAAENVEHAVKILESAGQGAAIGAMIGGGPGAAFGAAAGALKGAIVEFADEWSGNAAISREIRRMQREITRLGQTYDELSWQAEKSYGACTVGARNAVKANKELQLAEAERQLELERSRKKKNQDKDEIQRLEGEVASLRREINDTTDDVINDLLGISSAGAGIEGLVQVMIDAFKQGEDAMTAFGDKWDEMIDNMILKLIVSKVMEQEWDSILAEAKKIQDEATKAAAEKKQELEHMSDDEWLMAFAKSDRYFNAPLVNGKPSERAKRDFEQYGEQYKEQTLAEADEALHLASIKAVEDVIAYMSTTGRDRMYGKLDETLETISQHWNFGEDSNKQLSLLQQGIQGITEDTASALESYMNGVSQQVYLHSSILGQIRDAIVTPESGIEEQLDLMRQAAGLSEDEAVKSDLQMGVMSQMLLQLQASYQMQGAIYSMLNGWSNADGQSVRVTMIS